jgi:hypothetical protein
MLGDKKPSELDDWTLTLAWEKCGQVMAQREKTSKHPKFNDGPKRMEFPPPNPAFIEIMNSIEEEMKKRKLL